MAGIVFDALKEWALNYVRHRDIQKKIFRVKDADFGFVIENNDGTSSDCLIAPSLSGGVLLGAARKPSMVISLSNEQNIKEVYAVWDNLVVNSSLFLVFINPFSSSEDKWVLKPFLHNKVCDRSSLLQGLRAMSELVDPVDEASLSESLKASR